MKGPIAPPVAQSPLSPIKLFRWARQAISGIAGPFYIVTLLALVPNVMTQYNAQLIANFIGQAQREATIADSAASAEHRPRQQPSLSQPARLPAQRARRAWAFSITCCRPTRSGPRSSSR